MVWVAAAGVVLVGVAALVGARGLRRMSAAVDDLEQELARTDEVRTALRDLTAAATEASDHMRSVREATESLRTRRSR